jgi:hypothetical protein
VIAERILMIERLALCQHIYSTRLTPEQDNEKSFDKALVGPVKCWWVLGVLLLDNPAVDPGHDMNHDHVEKAVVSISLVSRS